MELLITGLITGLISAILFFLIGWGTTRAKLNSVIAELNQRIESHQKEIVARAKAITERDEQISQRDKAIAERDKQISQRDEAITERDNRQLVLCHVKVDGYRSREHSSLLQEDKRNAESRRALNTFHPSF